MIRKISFKNFYSFQDSFEMSFLTSKKNTFDYMQSKVDKYQISKIATIIGGNASGKTNIVRLFKFIQDFITKRPTDKLENISQETSLSYKTFFNNDNICEIKLELEKNQKIFFYTLKIQKNIVLLEKMQVKTKGKRLHNIFERDSNGKLQLSEIYFDKINALELKLPDIKNNVSVIAFFSEISFKIDIMEEIKNMFSGLLWQVNMNESSLNDKNIYLASWIYTEIPEVFEEMKEFISKFDIGLESFNIDKKDNGSFDIKGIHGNKSLDFKYESRGTKSLYELLGPIFLAMKYKGLVVIDELEMGLHPEAVEKLISYFLSESENIMCQFIFSTHSINILNKLDREQIFIVDKNNKGESEVYRVSDIENSRPDENFVKKYMSGKYGGFPKIKV
jgi:predicted ATPase